jgi:NAD+ synthase (glutamine-hydrolysing)
MRSIKIGLSNLDTTVGAMRSNCDKLISFARRMSAERCTVGCFSEQVISGYPSEDLVQWRGFVEQQWRGLIRFAEATRNLDTIFTLGLTAQESNKVYNCAAVVWNGKIMGVVPKEQLPTYEVFYEQRTFSPGVAGRVTDLNGVPFGDLIFRFPFGTLAVEVCEDLWTADGPTMRRAYSGAELVINASASPWRAGMVDLRRKIISEQAATSQVALVYVNKIGGQDSLVFDGGGFMNQNGEMFAEAPRWREGLFSCVIDLDYTTRKREQNSAWQTDCEKYLSTNPPVHVIECAGRVLFDMTVPNKLQTSALPRLDARAEYFEDLLSAMTWGLKGYFEKTGVFDRIGIALSGGKDSVLTLIIAWLYAGERFAGLAESERVAAIRDFIHAFSLPTRFNSDTTRGISRQICDELGVSFFEFSIEDAFAREVEATRQMLGEKQELTGITKQNIQARIRAARMWNWANSSRGLFLQTGNMSEKAVGYTTVGGDLMGAYSLIGNLPKTIVIELLRYLGEKYKWPSIQTLLATRASAELEENQEDERDLMPFAVLDDCFALFAGEKLMPLELYQAMRAKWSDEELKKLHPEYKPGMLKEWVIRFVKLFVGSIYKWVQAPQAVHLGTLDLDRERALQLPVVQSLEWLELERVEEKDEG